MKLEIDLYNSVNMNDLEEEIRSKLERATETMVEEMFELIKEKAQTSLHLSKQTYMESLSDPKLVKPGAWEIEFGCLGPSRIAIEYEVALW